MSRRQDYVNGVPCEVAKRIMRKRKKKRPVKPFRWRDDNLKFILQTNTKQTTLKTQNRGEG